MQTRQSKTNPRQTNVRMHLHLLSCVWFGRLLQGRRRWHSDATEVALKQSRWDPHVMRACGPEVVALPGLLGLLVHCRAGLSPGSYGKYGRPNGTLLPSWSPCGAPPPHPAQPSGPLSPPWSSYGAPSPPLLAHGSPCAGARGTPRGVFRSSKMLAKRGATQ